MRLNLNNVNAHLIYELEKAAVIDRVLQNGFDVVLVRLPSGQKVAIHLVERDITVGLIKQTLEYNARNDAYTLFILWCAMLLPDDGTLYFPYDWMSALLMLYDDKIYAFETEGANVWIFPVHFDAEPGTFQRAIRYGGPVDIYGLNCDFIHTETHFISGQWRIADFEQRRKQGQRSNQERPFSTVRTSISAYFEVLGVSANADFETVKRAYRQLAMLYHPDVNKSPEATQKMQQINAAYTQIAALFES